MHRADGLALSVAAGQIPEGVTEAEYAGLLVRALDLQEQLDTAEREAEAHIDAGDEARADILRRQATEVTGRLERVVKAADRLAVAFASPFSLRRMRADAEAFTTNAVLRRAKIEKGAALTDAEQDRIDSALAHLRNAEAQVTDLERTAEEQAHETPKRGLPPSWRTSVSGSNDTKPRRRRPGTATHGATAVDTPSGTHGRRSRATSARSGFGSTTCPG